MKFESIIQLNRYLDAKAEMRDVELQNTLEIVEYQIQKALEDQEFLEVLYYSQLIEQPCVK